MSPEKTFKVICEFSWFVRNIGEELVVFLTFSIDALGFHKGGILRWLKLEKS
jgi:hypothetical protein